MFVRAGAAQQRAKRVCNGCPVVQDCLAYALDNRVKFGIYGNQTERERKALLNQLDLRLAQRSEDRRNDPVPTWEKIFAKARARQAVLAA